METAIRELAPMPTLEIREAGPCYASFHGTFCRKNSLSGNNNYYPAAAVEGMVQRAQLRLADPGSRPIQVLASHSSADRDATLEIVGRLTEVYMDGDMAHYKGELANTAAGRDVAHLMAGGFQNGVSLRSDKHAHVVPGMVNGKQVNVVKQFDLDGLDSTLKPGLPNDAFVRGVQLFESVDPRSVTVDADAPDARSDQARIGERERRAAGYARQWYGMVREAVDAGLVPVGTLEETIKELGPILEKRFPQDTAFGAADRARINKAEWAGRYQTLPIVTQDDVAEALNLAGHAANPEALRRSIEQRATRKGLLFTDEVREEQEEDAEPQAEHSAPQAEHLDPHALDDQRDDEPPLEEHEMNADEIKELIAASVREALVEAQAAQLEESLDSTPDLFLTLAYLEGHLSVLTEAEISEISRKALGDAHDSIARALGISCIIGTQGSGVDAPLSDNGKKQAPPTMHMKDMENHRGPGGTQQPTYDPDHAIKRESAPVAGLTVQEAIALFESLSRGRQETPAAAAVAAPADDARFGAMADAMAQLAGNIEDMRESLQSTASAAGEHAATRALRESEAATWRPERHTSVAENSDAALSGDSGLPAELAGLYDKNVPVEKRLHGFNVMWEDVMRREAQGGAALPTV